MIEGEDEMEEADGGLPAAHGHAIGIQVVNPGDKHEAMQYGFFADGGDDEGLGEELGGLEDGVDAPPEEELLDEGSLGPTENRIWSETNGLTHQLHDGRMSNSTVETAQDAGGNVQGPFQDLSIAGSLLSQQSKQAPKSLLTPDSFAADPVAGPPRRHSSTSTDWPSTRSLRTTSLTQPGVSTPLARGSDEASQYSIFGPSPSFSQGPELAAATGPRSLSRVSADSLQSSHGRSERVPWQQQLLQRGSTRLPPPAEKRPLTLEEVEARLYSQPSDEPSTPVRISQPTIFSRPQLNTQLHNQFSPGQYPFVTQQQYGSRTAQIPGSLQGQSPHGLQNLNLDVNIHAAPLSTSLPSGILRHSANPGMSPGMSPVSSNPNLSASPGLVRGQVEIQAPPRPPAPIINMPNLQRRSFPGQPGLPGAPRHFMPNQLQRPFGANLQQVWQAGQNPTAPRLHPQQLIRPNMLVARGGRGFMGPGLPQAGNYVPGRQLLPPPEDGSALSLRYHGSKFMLPDEIDSILRIQWKSLHNGAPYQEDYYYQALMNKITNGSNSREFTPDALRDLAPSEKTEEEPLTYVKLEGLGKIPYSDVKRPKPVMDLVASPNNADAEKGEEEQRSKPLEEEPLLAARIVIEDCMCLLLDVDDIDRVLKNHFRGREDEQTASLRVRRIVLLDAMANSLRLPHTSVLKVGGEVGEEETDAVLRRLSGLLKGRKLVSRFLRLLDPKLGPLRKEGIVDRKIPAQRMLWATMRISYVLFSIPSPFSISSKSDADQEHGQGMMDTTTEIALALIKIIKRMETPQAIADCMTALVNGDLGSKSSESSRNVDNWLPLLPSGEPSPTNRTWLAEIISVLLTCALERGLSGQLGQDSNTFNQMDEEKRKLYQSWSENLQLFWTYLERHLNALADVYVLAREAGAEPAANYAREMVPRNLIQAFLPHATQTQHSAMLATLSKIFQ